MCRRAVTEAVRRLTATGWRSGGESTSANHECNDLVIDEHEAQVVKLIFEKYVNEEIGGHRLVRYLLEQGIRNRTGDNFPNTSITRMLKNIAYIGVLKSNDTYSDIFEHGAALAGNKKIHRRKVGGQRK